MWQDREQGHLCRASPASSEGTRANLELNQSQSCCRPLGSGTVSSRHWGPGMSPRATTSIILLSTSVTHGSAGQQHGALVLLSAFLISPSPGPQFLPIGNTSTIPTTTGRGGVKHPKNPNISTSIIHGTNVFAEMVRKGRALLRVFLLPQNIAQKGLTSHKEQSTKGKRTLQRTRGVLWHELCLVLSSALLPLQKNFSLLPISWSSCAP